MFLCNECAKAIIQSGKKVIYKEDKYEKEDSFKAAKHMFNLAGVVYERYSFRGERIEIDIKKI